MARVKVGDFIRRRELVTIRGDIVALPDVKRLLHLQFRRYAGCPVCNLHLTSVARRQGDILAAGVCDIVVFHSNKEIMLEFQGQLPFPAIADPEKELYSEYGVEQMSPWLAFHPRSWRAATRALTQTPDLRGAMGKGEEHMGLPAEFLIGSDGLVLAAKYGLFVDDHWSVDELLDLVEVVRSHHQPKAHNRRMIACCRNVPISSSSAQVRLASL
jgi:peroxiredoxin